MKLNKLSNVFLFNGDARDVVDRMFGRIIGLKSSIDKNQMQKRLELGPRLMEIHLHPHDLDENMDKIEKTIRGLKKKGIEVTLHAPMRLHGMEQNLSAEDEDVVANSVKACRVLEGLCKRYGLPGYVAHANTDREEERGYKNSIKVLEETVANNRLKKAMVENCPHGFFSDVENVRRFIRKTGLRLCLDVVHLFMSRKTDESFYDFIMENGSSAYFHIADTNLRKHDSGTPHAFEIGKGDVDFSRIVPYADYGVIEVTSKDEDNPHEMLDSYRKYHEMLKKYLIFDRIIMPLPRGGENFLDVALRASQKGTIIHFYDFLHEDDFNLAKEKVRKACAKAKRKHKILDMVKCGQYSPRTFRVCLDFMIL